MSVMADQIRDLIHEVSELKQKTARMLRTGTVAAVDPEKGYRVDFGLGSDGKPFASDWIPHPDSGGKASTWMPLSVGQIVGVACPAGDLRQAFLVRAGFGGTNAAPSQDLGEVVLVEQGDVRISVASGRFTVKVGSAVLELTPDRLAALVDVMQVTGSALKHNAKSVGDTHGHVSAPPGDPGPPV